MSDDTQNLKTHIVEAALRLSRLGLNCNKSGNVSARTTNEDGQDGFWITPSGLPYEELTESALVWLPLNDPLSVNRALGPYRPSSEWEMHARVYRQRADMAAVVHTHSLYATALACQGLSIPPFHYMVAAAGGMSIDVTPYATFGSSELATRAAKALADKKATLLAHHGVLVCGKTLHEAISLANEVENLAHQYVIVRGLGSVELLTEMEMRKVLEKFKTYGQVVKDSEQE